jgi:putative nucleotidyltransferase with HDIG domain
MEIVLPGQVREFVQTIQKAGFEVFAVGGSVRDLLLSRPTKTWDFTTSATPEQIQKIFPESFYNNSFGTVGVKMADGDIYEITTFRREGKYSDSRHPDEISWAKTVEEDLARRELTISAIATNGKIIVDPYDGQGDLKRKVVRAVGVPADRFTEDPLRMIRAIRIATQLGFTIEESTFSAIKKGASQISIVSSERVRDELIKILSSDYPADGIRLLQNAELLEFVLPELTKGVGITQKGTHHTDDVYEHSLKALAACPNTNWVVRLAVLLHDVGKSFTFKEKNGKATFYNHEVVGAHLSKDIASRLHFSKADRDKLYMLVRWHMFSVSEFLTDAAIRRFIRRVGAENTTDMLDLRTSDRVGSGSKKTSWRHEDFKDRIIEVQKHIPSVNDLAIDGNDVMKILKIKPGPKIGQILKSLFEEITEDPSKNTREYLEKRVKIL